MHLSARFFWLRRVTAQRRLCIQILNRIFIISVHTSTLFPASIIAVHTLILSTSIWITAAKLISDFIFSARIFPAPQARTSQQSTQFRLRNAVPGNAVLNCCFADRSGAAILTEGSLISDDKQWNYASDILLGQCERFQGEAYSSYRIISNTNWRGQWLNCEDKYLGLRFMLEGEVHYGWIRLSVVLEETQKPFIGISAYAYGATPGVAITVPCEGDCPQVFDEIKIYSSSNTIFVSLPECSTDDMLTVYDMSGMRIFEGAITRNRQQFPLLVANGNYIAVVRSQDAVTTQKLHITY